MNAKKPNWMKKNKLTLQSAALTAAVLAPFGMYAAAQAANPLLGWASFVVFCAAMLLTFLVS
ncbi:MAG: hypothetical protein HY835_12680 [Anaerolineae bacterium]|nr:hypothetical protein [Anaerolineae bacterium]